MSHGITIGSDHCRGFVPLALLFVLLVLTVPALSQNSPDVVADYAKSSLKEGQQLNGFYGDRCSLGVILSPNLYVVRIITPDSSLRLGDRITKMGGESVGQSYRSYYAVLGQIAPDAKVQATVDRLGTVENVDVQCTNGRPYSDATRRVLESMAKRKWRDCVAEIRDIEAVSGRGASTAHQFLDCGFHAREFSPQQVPMVAYEFWRRNISESQWDPIEWPTVRGEALGLLSVFESNGQARLAADLQRQIDAIDRDMDSRRASAKPPTSAGRSTGTGFLADSNGLVITSNHVVAGTSQITVRCGQRKPVAATVKANSATTDIAILATEMQDTPYLSLTRPRSAAVGQRIFTYGFPVTEILGAEPKFTDGTVSALSGIGGEQTYLQISIPVQPGNSGGPVVNEAGEVIGIVAAGAAIEPFLRNTGTLPQNVNWAVKSEYAALLFELPDPRPRAASRDDAIRRVEASLCFIEAR